MLALKIDYRNYQTYANLASTLGQTALPKAEASQRFAVVVKEGGVHRLEIYDETDFRTYFKWVDKPKQDAFTSVERIEPQEDGENVKWEPSGGDDLGAV